jgi:hypothetical protein
VAFELQNQRETIKKKKEAYEKFKRDEEERARKKAR